MKAGKTETMQAAVLRGELQLAQVPVPAPGPGEVLVAVEAFGINNAEILQCAGAMPAPPGGIPGLECVGTVVDAGSGVHRWQPGDRVAVLTRAGAYAEYVCVDEDACLAVGELDPHTAAAVPEAAATAWWNLKHRASLQPGERVLIHGAAGGVGTMAVQVARAMGAHVIGTARGAGKVGVCTDLGCHDVIDYGCTDVFAALRQRFPDGVDVIVDNQGAATLRDNIAALAPLGRLVVVGVASGTETTVDLGQLMAGGVEVSSSSLGRLDDALRAAICREVETEVLPRVCDGTIRPVIDQVFTLDDIAAAHQRFSAPDRIGKVIVTVPAYISKKDVGQRN